MRLLLVVAALLALLALAAVSPSLAATTPPELGYPNPAYVQMQFVEISKIDGVEQAFHADFYILTTWASPPADNFTIDMDLSKEDLGKNFWAPQLEFINARDEVTRLVEEPYAFLPDVEFAPTMFDQQGRRVPFVKPDDWVWITEDQRIQCDFTTPLLMHSFPFDKQFMQLQIESYWDANQTKIIWAEPDKIAQLIPDTMPDIVGWDYLDSAQFNTVNLLQYNNRAYDRLTVRMLLERQPEFYLSKIVSGSMMLVYMCVWIFALAVDEADRMMGTMTVFGGLVTFLFVASGDTPKVPYQTRLDVFMLFSFLNVAVMLIIHGALYYWRECDIADFLEQRDQANDGGNYGASDLASPSGAKGGGGVKPVGDADDVEMVEPQQSSPRVYVNDPAATSSPNHGSSSALDAAAAVRKLDKWFLRKNQRSEWSLRAWWSGLHFTRRVDAICMFMMTAIYTIGTAVILGRPLDDPPNIHEP